MMWKKHSSLYLIVSFILEVSSCWGFSSSGGGLASDLSSPTVSVVSSTRIGWIGLGTMGEHMAMHLQNRQEQLNHDNDDNSVPPFPAIQVWNRNLEKAKEHSNQYGTKVVPNLSDMCYSNNKDEDENHPSIIFLSMPTTAEVKEILLSLTDLPRGSIIVDTTSGVPSETRSIAQEWLDEQGIFFVDCPVSGGLAGAKAGSLTCMVGCNDMQVFENIIKPLLESSFAGKVVHCGPSGSGMAVKAINNVLMSAHLLLGAEGLLSLKKFGVDPTVALDVINSSSGRSLQTMERLPQDVLTGNFDFGFKLPLMAKDCRIATSITTEQFPQGTLIPEVSKLMNQANALFDDENTDVTEAVKMLEDLAGTDLRSSSQEEEEP